MTLNIISFFNLCQNHSSLAERRRELLLEAMAEVLSSVSHNGSYTLVLQADKQQSVMTENPVIENIAQGGGVQEPANDHNTFHSSLR